MFLLVSLPILLLSTVLINSLFRHKSKTAYVLGALLIGYANIVLISEVASLFNLITPAFFLIAQLIVAGIAWLSWLRLGKPSLLGPFADGKWAIWREFPTFQTRPGLYILAFGVILVYLFGAGMILILPQNNYDGMTYHLSRVGYWMQHQTLSPWLTPNPRQTTSPINAELGLLWTTLLWGSDRLTGFVQWFSALGIAVAIYGLARLMGARRSQGVFASLLWATFPQIVLQSITTQNDLVVAFFFISMLYFLFLGLRNKKVEDLCLSGMAFGLALGTKATFFLILPGFGITLILIWTFSGRNGFRQLMIWGAASLIGMGLFGIFSYVQNQIFYGDPFSIPEWTSYITNPGTYTSPIGRGITNLGLYFSQFIDFSGLPNGFAHILENGKAVFFRKLFLGSGLDSQLPKVYSFSTLFPSSTVIHEDTSWFGPLSLLLIPAAVINLWQGYRKKAFVRLGLGLTAIGFYVTLSFLLGWTPYRVRYFVLAVSVLAPLLAFIYQPVEKRVVLYSLVSFLGIWVMVSCVMQNVSKPLIGPKAIWNMNPIDIRMSNNPKMKPVLEMVAENVPQNAVLGTRLGVDHWDYVLFGDHFKRTVLQLDPLYPGIDEDFIKDTGVDYVLVAPRERPFLTLPQGLSWVGDVSGWYLLAVSDGIVSNNPERISQQLLGQSDEKGLLEVDGELAGTVGLTELYSGDWGVERYDQNAFKWLGEGLNQGLQGFLWSEVEIPVKIIFHLEPGPSREDTQRTLQVAYYRYGPYGPIYEGAVVNEVQIDQPERYEMIVDLQKGLNEFRILDLDYATIPVLPNGDYRPLLTLLTHIEVLPLEDNPTLFSVDDSFGGNIRVAERYLADWGLEYADDQPFQWLGEGLEQGFRGYLWSEEDIPVRIMLHLVPGPARGDLHRNLEVSFGRYGYFEDFDPLSTFVEFDSPTQYEMDVTLYKGLNELALAVLDEANIEILPNGDTRPLLVQLVQIDVLPINE